MFEKAKNFIAEKKAAIGIGFGTVAGSLAPCVAFADDATVASTLTTGVTSAVSEAQTAILAILPQALVLMGVILGITVGVRIFKRIGQGRG